MKPANATFYGGRKLTTTKFSFFVLKLDKVLRNSIPGKIAYIGQIERVQIDAIKFKRT